VATAKKIANDPPNQDSVPADAIERIRAWLIDTGYAESATLALTRGTPEDEAAAKTASELPAVQLLLYGSALALKEAKKLFTAKDLKTWIDAGLLAKDKSRVRPLVRISPYRKLFVLSDCDWRATASTSPNAVMGVTGSSTWLADFTIRRDCDCTLDLGTGTGVQAMLAAKHSKQVVATDINPRALEFARFNAALNGIENIEFVEGDMFEAVAGRTFDLIVSNPPFVVTPATGCLYRDNPMDADEFVKQIIQTAPSFLNDGGYAQILCDWIQQTDESWKNRLFGWLKPTGCDVSIARGKSFSPAEYARQLLAGYDSSNGKKLFGEWMSYYEERAIVAIDNGLITMRRSDREPNWLRIDTKLPRIFPDAGTQVARCFWLQDFLAHVPGPELLNEILYLSPSVELTQTSKPTITGWKLRSCQLTMTRGIGYAVKLDPAIARVVTACNGRAQLGQLLQAMAIADGESLDVIATRYLPAIRQLVMLGFLWPARHGLDTKSVPAKSESSEVALPEEAAAAEVARVAAQA